MEYSEGPATHLQLACSKFPVCKCLATLWCPQPASSATQHLLELQSPSLQMLHRAHSQVQSSTQHFLDLCPSSFQCNPLSIFWISNKSPSTLGSTSSFTTPLSILWIPSSESASILKAPQPAPQLHEAFSGHPALKALCKRAVPQRLHLSMRHVLDIQYSRTYVQ